MSVRVVFVVHTDKEGMAGRPELAGLPAWMQNLLIVNAPLSVKGCVEAGQLVEKLDRFGPFVTRAYCSQLGRTGMVASFFALRYGLELESMEKLGQKASKEKDGHIHCLPGNEVDYVKWQNNAVDCLREIGFSHGDDNTALAFSHGPQVAGAALFTKGITDPKAIKDAIPVYREKGFIVLDVASDGAITLVEE